MTNPENNNFEAEFQKFSQKNENENSAFKANKSNEIADKEEFIKGEENLFLKFKGKAKTIARFLILLTGMTFLSKPEVTYHGTISDKPKIVEPEKKTDYSDDKDFQKYQKYLEGDYTQILRDIHKIDDKPWVKEIFSELASKQPSYILEYLNSYIEEPWAKDVIENAFNKSHDNAAISRQAYYLCQKDWGVKIYTKSIVENPYYFGDGFRDKRILPILDKVNDPHFQTILSIGKSDSKNKFQLFTLAKDISEGKISEEEARKIASDKTTFFNYLIKNPENFEHKYSHDQIKNYSLNTIYEINAYHNENDDKRFNVANNLNSEGIYTLLIEGSEELYTSSFNGLFDRLLNKIKKEKINSGYELMQKMNMNGMRNFIESLARYNRLEEFLATMGEDKQKILMEQMIDGIKNEKDRLKEASIVADIFGIIKDPKLLKIFQDKIKENYLKLEQIGNHENLVMYGLLASLYESNYHADDSWFKDIQKKFEIPSLKKLTQKEFFSQKGINIQKYYFYNDDDGKMSFDNFINAYKNDSNWQIVEKDYYVTINSKNNGNKILIYANKPIYNETGPSVINRELNKNDVVNKNLVVVHRGHSYHVGETEKQIKNDINEIKFVFLASCGGTRSGLNILEKNPNVQIIATKGKGRSDINDEILKSINEQMLLGDIEWSEFWANLDKKFKSNSDSGIYQGFLDYISPDKNTANRFISAYSKYLSK